MPKQLSPATLKEIRHLRAGAGPNVVALREVVFREEKGALLVVCVLDYAEHDLLGVTARRIRFGRESVRHVFGEVVRGVAHLHSRGIFHRDLKTANILLDSEGNVRVADLGLAEQFLCRETGHNARLKGVLAECLPRIQDSSECAAERRAERAVDDCVAVRSFHCEATTLLYRAPEQLLKVAGGYSHQSDVWSLGCILLELLFGRPFFLAAKSREHLLALLPKLFGRRAFAEWAEGLQSAEFGQREKVWKYADFGEYLAEAGVEPVAADLLTRLLQVDPARRIGCGKILAHAFFAGALPRAELRE